MQVNAHGWLAFLNGYTDWSIQAASPDGVNRADDLNSYPLMR